MHPLPPFHARTHARPSSILDHICACTPTSARARRALQMGAEGRGGGARMTGLGRTRSLHRRAAEGRRISTAARARPPSRQPPSIFAQRAGLEAARAEAGGGGSRSMGSSLDRSLGKRRARILRSRSLALAQDGRESHPAACVRREGALERDADDDHDHTRPGGRPGACAPLDRGGCSR